MFGFNFGGMGGFPGHNHDDNDNDDQPQSDTDNSKYYTLLGVQKDATTEQIKQAYDKLEQEYKKAEEPDMERVELQQLAEAYEVLSDPQAREMYDQFGGSSQPSEEDMMQMFFGGGKPKGQSEKPKSQPLKQLLQITLQQSYNGDKTKVPVKRYRLCKACNGLGGADIKKCTDCKGQGQIAPGMVQQIAQPCTSCSGEGQIISEESKCKECDAKQVKEEDTIVEVQIPRGINSQQAIVVTGEGHQLPERLVGDLVLVVKVSPGETFVRMEDNLHFKKTISLIEGITGVFFNLTHLDKKVYTLEGYHHEIIGDKQKKVVKGLGMPVYRSPAQFGDLIIEFHVSMPEKGSITPEAAKELATILPGEMCERPKDHHFQLLEDFDHADLNTNEEGGRGNDEDEDDEGQPQGVQCAAQ